ncbi:MAG: adenylosuccinate lyase [candidate division Zixibacteria bacterium]|nr:adenylosuccinate lyase [candidate division Zixibacteria bacterium]
MIARYTTPEIGRLWTDDNRFSTWLKVELTVAEVQAEMGIIPRSASRTLTRKAKFSVARIDRIEAKVKHDVVAFLTSVSENVGPAAKYLHYGMTSSDLLDTALGVTLKEAGRIIMAELKESIKLVRQKARRYKMTPAIGRTHGIHAEPTTLGLKFLLWHEELRRHQARLKSAIAEVAVGKISGAVGNYANLDPKVETAVCRRLKIKAAPISTQVIQRDRHATFLSAIAVLGASLEKFTVEIRHLQRTEVREMEEGFSRGQKGSSAMPHKRNPVTCENISGLARVLRGNLIAALENIPLWHERDISHSSVERVILPDSTILIVHMLRKFNDIMRNLIVNKDNLKKNLDLTGGLVCSGRLLLKLAEACGSREKAYRLVQRNAMVAWEGKTAEKFADLIAADREIQRWLTPEAIDECFDLNHYFRNVDKIYRKCKL